MDTHPYRTAWQTRDLDAWTANFAPDVVLRSPIISTPFKGRDEAAELFGVLFDTLGELDITDELADGGSHAFFWRVQIGSRWVEGMDLVRTDARGEIAEITVMIRPLADIAIFAAAIGPSLAGKRSPMRGPLARLLIMPLRAVLTLADVLSSRLIKAR